jgi:capsular polysaccharide biosynthesis protein
MKSNIKAEFKPDSIDLINFIISHFRVFLVTGILAAVMSAVISLLIKPLYESTVILYPSSNITEARTLLGEASSKTTLFGDDDATEKLLQVISSEQVRDYLKMKYSLADHYNIKPSEKYPQTLIAEKMDRFIHSSRTSFGSVEIRVRDRDRELACAMANDMASQGDTIFNKLQRNAAAAMLDEISRSYEMQDRLVRQYEDSLKNLEGAAVLKAYATLDTETEYLGLIRGRYLEALALSQQTLPYTLVVDRAVVAEKKVYPRRSIMVIVSTLSVLVLAALILFLAEGVKVHRTDERH